MPIGRLRRGLSWTMTQPDSGQPWHAGPDGGWGGCADASAGTNSRARGSTARAAASSVVFQSKAVSAASNDASQAAPRRIGRRAERNKTHAVTHCTRPLWPRATAASCSALSADVNSSASVGIPHSQVVVG